MLTGRVKRKLPSRANGRRWGWAHLVDAKPVPTATPAASSSRYGPRRPNP